MMTLIKHALVVAAVIAAVNYVNNATGNKVGGLLASAA